MSCRPAPLPPMRCGLDPSLRRPTVFSTRAALAAGVSPERLRRSDLQSVRRGLWRVRDAAPERGDVLRALQDLHPSGAFSHTTALDLLGLWRTGELRRDGRVHIASPSRHTGARHGGDLVLHQRPAESPTLIVDGVRVTAPAWTLVDVAGAWPRLRRENLVALGDGAARTAHSRRRRRDLPVGAIGLDVLREGIQERRGARGVRDMLDALADVREGVDSPMESLVRTRLVAEGLPEPAVNPVVVLETGQPLRVDMAWLGARLVVEYDGDQHRTDRAQYQEDRERDRGLRSEGWEVMRIDSSVFRPERWAMFVLQVRSVLAGRRGMFG